jgi:hypothetical protein
MASCAMLHRVALVRTDVSEELSASIRVTRISELGTTLAVTSNRRTLRRINGVLDYSHCPEFRNTGKLHYGNLSVSVLR